MASRRDIVLIKLPEKVENKKMVITESSIQDVFQLYGQGVGKAVKASDLRKIFEQIGFPMTDSHCENLIEVADRDGDGCLDLKEFVNFVLYGVLQIDESEDDIIECFRVFDPHDTGFIESQELRRIMTQLGDELSDTEINKVIKQSDIDRDGSINYVEYVKRVFEGNKRYEQVNKRASWDKILKKMTKGKKGDKEESTMSNSGSFIGGGLETNNNEL